MGKFGWRTTSTLYGLDKNGKYLTKEEGIDENGKNFMEEEEEDFNVMGFK